LPVRDNPRSGERSAKHQIPPFIYQQFAVDGISFLPIAICGQKKLNKRLI